MSDEIFKRRLKAEIYYQINKKLKETYKKMSNDMIYDRKLSINFNVNVDNLSTEEIVIISDIIDEIGEDMRVEINLQ
jgi:hypothetical protein